MVKKIEIVLLEIFLKEFRDLEMMLFCNYVKTLFILFKDSVHSPTTSVGAPIQLPVTTYISAANHVAAIQCIKACGHERTRTRIRKKN